MSDATVIAAIIGAGAALLTSIPIAYLGHRLAVRRFEAEVRLSRRIRNVLVEMMSSEKWDARSLEHMKSVLTGIEDNELRKALIEIGAVCVGRDDDREMWSMLNARDGRAFDFLQAS